MSKAGSVKWQALFVPAGLVSALLTLTLGARWVSVLVLGTGGIFSAILLATDGLWSRDSLFAFGVGPAALVAAVGFYWALRIFSNVRRTALLQLILIGLITAILSGAIAVWGGNYLVLRQHLFISPVWVTLLLVAETGFAWVWGKSSLTA